MPYIKVNNDFLTTDMLTWPEKRIYMVLQMYAGVDGDCFPTYETIASAAGLQRRRVIALVKSLSEKGWLSIEKRKDKTGQHSNSYVLLNPLSDPAENSVQQTVRDRFWYSRILAEEPEKSLETDAVYKVLELLLNRNVSTTISKETFSSDDVKAIINTLTYEEIRSVVLRYYSNRYSVKSHVSYISALLLKAREMMAAEDEIRKMYDQTGAGVDRDLEELLRLSERGRRGW